MCGKYRAVAYLLYVSLFLTVPPIADKRAPGPAFISQRVRRSYYRDQPVVGVYLTRKLEVHNIGDGEQRSRAYAHDS